MNAGVLALESEVDAEKEESMADEREARPTSRPGGPPEATRGRHPTEEGDPVGPPAVPEDENIVPNRHSASAEAAWMRWRETHEEG